MLSLIKKVNEKVSVEAVLSGVALDGVITSIFSFFLSVPFVISVIHQHGTELDKSQLLAIFGDYVNTSPFFLLIAMVLGGIAIVIGGYLAAYLAKRSALLSGFSMGVIGAIFSWIQAFGFSVDPKNSEYANQLASIQSTANAFYWVLVAASPFLGLLGSYLYLKLHGLGPMKTQFFKKIGLTALFKGRMGRWAALASGVVVVVIYGIGVATLFFVGSMLPLAFRLIAFFTGEAIFLIFTIAVAVVSYSITVRRLHDIGLSGWLGLMSYMSYIGTLFVLFEIFWPGTKGANKYGEAHDEFSLVYALTGKH